MILWSVHRRPTCTLTRWPGGFRLELLDGTLLAGRPAELATLKTRVLSYLQEPTPTALPSSEPAAPPVPGVPGDNALVVARPTGAHTLDLGLATASGTCALSLRELYDLATVLEQTQPIASTPVWQQAAGWGALGVALSLALGLYHWLQPALVVQRPNLITAVPPRPAEAPTAKTPPTPADAPPPPPVTGVGTLPPPPNPGPWPVVPLAVPQSLPPPPPVAEPKPPTSAPVPAPPPTAVSRPAGAPSLHDLHTYFAEQWQPPTNLGQPLVYDLVVTPAGALAQITPQNEKAGLFLDRTPMPLVGETFMGGFPWNRPARMRLTFRPNGQVDMLFLGWQS